MSGFLNTFAMLLADVGMGNPISRAVTLGCVGFGVQFFLKPSISYTTVAGKGGNKQIAKDFAFTSKASPAMTTWFPWYMWPASFAIIGGLFI